MTRTLGVRAAVAVMVVAAVGGGAFAQGSDNCSAGAPIMPTLGGPWSNLNATTSFVGNLSFCGLTASEVFNDVWFRWTSPVTGPVTMDTYPAGWDTVIAVYQGPSCPSVNAVPVACNDDEPGGSLWSQVTFDAVEGTLYFLQLGSQNGFTDGASDLTVFTTPPGMGACCTGSQCTESSGAACGGTFHGDGTACTPALCCPADFNASGSVDVIDIFSFLAAWFSRAPEANFNGDGAVDAIDIFAYLAVWFAGCP